MLLVLRSVGGCGNVEGGRAVMLMRKPAEKHAGRPGIYTRWLLPVGGALCALALGLGVIDVA